MSNSGSQIDIGASTGSPGTADRSNAFDRGQRDPALKDPAPNDPGPVDPATGQTCASPLCRTIYSVVNIPEVTIDDLASFRPTSPSLTGEPAGFGVVGMPANVVAAGSEQLIPGNLLGWDVVVRFRPAAYVFAYGDGSTQRVTTGGATWEQLGQAQFTPTATSHVYRERGTYPVSVTVQYAAAVDFGTGWRPVQGYVSATTGGYDVRVVEVKTALVDRTCVENPSGPGC
ncbi:hypothetical protein G5T42_16440 [Microbacterium sp. 4R-513]|uniref:hypothetical protein n=1 Tax=Microbacterium sp. 4R-513 TaxID=2567934 RepID=UPI0013E1C8F6|nr:hypothetical protein [Microbacterium sp. 4R-513]QIG40866.1 hypothetical protein G5T42_16440 [Microbacterium sp. 4R-513]